MIKMDKSDNPHLVSGTATAVSSLQPHLPLYQQLFEKYRDNINGPWEKMFPDAHDRPARHALKVDLRGKNLFQIEIIAVL